MARDMIYLFHKDTESLNRWLQRYHSASGQRMTGVIQNAVVLDLRGATECLSYHKHELFIEGPDGLLPNLDMVNLMVKMGAFKRLLVTPNGQQWFPQKFISNYYEQLLKMIWRQGTAFKLHPHAQFLKYRIDAVTLKAQSRPDIDSTFRSTFEMVEGTLRSLNNLLEHMHQSFFFYLLPKRDRFVSIANYAAAPALFAASFVFNGWFPRSQEGKVGNGDVFQTIFLITICILNAVFGSFLSFGHHAAFVFDLILRLAPLQLNGHHSLGCILYGMGILLLTITNPSLAILMGLPRLFGHRAAFSLFNPLLLLFLNKESWNFGIPYLLLYPANILMSLA